MKKIFFLSIALLLISNLYVSYSQYNEILGEYSDGAIVTQNGKRIWAEDIILFKDNVSFTLLIGTKDSLPLSDVMKIHAKKGSYSLECGIFGGSYTLLFFLYASLFIDQNHPNSYYSNYWEIALISTAIGTGVGALIGWAFPKYKDVYVNGRFITQLQHANPDYYIPVYNNQKIISIGINF